VEVREDSEKVGCSALFMGNVLLISNDPDVVGFIENMGDMGLWGTFADWSVGHSSFNEYI
jgi:hypothetical protein